MTTPDAAMIEATRRAERWADHLCTPNHPNRTAYVVLARAQLLGFAAWLAAQKPATRGGRER